MALGVGSAHADADGDRYSVCLNGGYRINLHRWRESYRNQRGKSRVRNSTDLAD
jgi:hypothetical protein